MGEGKWGVGINLKQNNHQRSKSRSQFPMITASGNAIDHFLAKPQRSPSGLHLDKSFAIAALPKIRKGTRYLVTAKFRSATSSTIGTECYAWGAKFFHKRSPLATTHNRNCTIMHHLSHTYAAGAIGTGTKREAQSLTSFAVRIKSSKARSTLRPKSV